jgi:hypothetical protein
MEFSIKGIKSLWLDNNSKKKPERQMNRRWAWGRIFRLQSILKRKGQGMSKTTRREISILCNFPTGFPYLPEGFPYLVRQKAAR